MKTYWDTSAVMNAAVSAEVARLLDSGEHVTRTHTFSEFFNRMTEEQVPPVEARRAGPEKPLHVRHQVSFGRLHHQMEKPSPQAQGMALPIRRGTGLAQGFEEPLSIGVIPEDRFPPVPAIHHMVDRAFKFDAQR